MEAGKAFLQERRERDANRRKKFQELRESGQPVVQTHGITGYQRGCRCSTCMSERKDAEMARKGLVGPDPDWSDVVHLTVGYGVRRRANGN
jgi:hypothetical protein